MSWWIEVREVERDGLLEPLVGAEKGDVLRDERGEMLLGSLEGGYMRCRLVEGAAKEKSEKRSIVCWRCGGGV